MKRITGLTALLLPILSLLLPPTTKGQPSLRREVHAPPKPKLKTQNSKPSSIFKYHQLSTNNYQSLTIGDKLPNLEIGNIINHKQNKLQTTNLQGKLIIVDFFATWCGSCIKELPRLDSLQKQFNDKIQILIVSYEPKNKIMSFLSSNKKAAQVSLPFVTNDTLLSKAFPHRILPHQVLIDQKGIVKAITKPAYTTAQNIQSILDGKTVRFPLKNDLLTFDSKQPLLTNANQTSDNWLLTGSVLTRYLDGAPAAMGAVVNADSTSKRFYFINRPLLAMYVSASGIAPSNRVLLEVKNHDEYINKAGSEEWMQEHAFCYEATVPMSLPGSKVNQWIMTDLNRGFNLNARVEERMVPCWALTTSNASTGMLNTKGGKPAVTPHTKDQPVTILQNQPLSVLVRLLNNQVITEPLKPIVINETNYNHKVDLQLCTPLTDLPALNLELQQYGLSLIQTHRLLPMLVITEN